jgi:hypothetical protein
VKAVIFNVKGFDLFHLDRWSSKFTEEDAETWREMGVSRPNVFRSIAYYAPERPERSGEAIPISTPRPADVRPFSWSLKDVVDFGLFELLFSDETRANENLITLINFLNHKLSTTRTSARQTLHERLGVAAPADNGTDARRQLTESFEFGFNGRNELNITTFSDLLEYIRNKAEPQENELTEESLRSMSRSTIQALYRRLLRTITARSGLLRRDESDGVPLNVATAEEDVCVIDLQSIADTHLQRFVIAAVLNQLVGWRSGPYAARDEVFLVVLDELNRYAPHGANDAITRLFEYVASQMRSRGIILFGAQQQGSRVSDVVIENSQTRALGRSGGQELADAIWRSFSEGDRKLALRLGPDEKVIVASNFREALHVKVPRPPWAMRQEEALSAPPAFLQTPDGPSRPAVSEEARRKAASFEP